MSEKSTLRSLETPLRVRIERLGRRRAYKAGQQVFEEGESATFLPIVLEGSIKMVRYPDVGKELILGVFEAGEIFAIPPALDGKQFPATAVALTDCRILKVPRPQFLELLGSSPEFSAMIMERMCGILRDRSETVRILASPSAEHRVAGVLLRLSGTIAEGEAKKIAMRRQDIAEMAGLTTEATIRAIRRLADKNLLKIVSGKIYLESQEPLKNFLKAA